MNQLKVIQLETSSDFLKFDLETGRLISFRSKAALDQEFILTTANDPVFVIQHLDQQRRFRQLTSNEAKRVEVRLEGASLVETFHGIGGVDVDVTVRVGANPSEPFSHWSITVANRAGLLITDVQFPFVVVPYHLAGTPGSEALLWPIGAGKLIQTPKPYQLEPDSPHAWQMRPENSDVLHYPGFTIAQFLAYCNDRAGLYIACQDSSGKIKLIKPVHHEPGLRLGISHVGDWPQQGERTLEYDVVLTSFTGDWYAAAELYRSWSRGQPWTQMPLAARKDIPEWLVDSPPHIILRIQGELDLGPAQPNVQFLPYSKTIPLLEAVAERVGSPVVPVIMSWEHPGPWIYPDCFPPAGGVESLREFASLALQRGWHIGTFCNGTRWVVGHYWSGYDGEDDFIEHNGSQSVCRIHTGDLWKESWDATWRPSYACCLGTPLTRETARHFIRNVIDFGLDWIQFLDQNVGCSTFPCFATDHEHPPLPGRWMTEKMHSLIDIFYELAAEAREQSKGERQIVFSVEGPVTEYFIPYFQICDIRVVPPGHKAEHWLWWDSAPLYHFLYHEFILMQGGFGQGADPHHLAIRNAYNLVVGEIPGAVMKGDGELLNVDSPGINWAPWEPRVGEDEEALRMLRSTTALRRGPGKDFVVYGRMLPPATIKGIKTMRWQYDGRDYQVPSVFHSAWQSPDNRAGVVLANWTKDSQQVSISDPRLGAKLTRHIAAESIDSKTVMFTRDAFELTLPPLSCALFESQGADARPHAHSSTEPQAI